MFNQITLLGNLTRDIELRFSQSGTAIANTGIATAHKFTSNGEKKEETMFIDLTFFSKSAEIANQYLRKGSKVFITGRLTLDQWEDKTDGKKRSKHTVIVETMKMLDSRSDSEGEQPRGANAPVSYEKKKLPESNLPEIDIDMESIPF